MTKNQSTAIKALDDSEELRLGMLQGETLGHDQIEGWRLWPSRQFVTDKAVQVLKSGKAARIS